MAQATLDAPLTLDPQQATKLIVRETVVDHAARTVRIHFDMVNSAGAILATRVVVRGGNGVNTWIANQEATIYAQLLAQLGVTGTVA